MNGAALSSLASPALAHRLADLCREERNVQADFLLHLDEYDRRRAYLEAGYGSLWTYCLEALHLRESAAGRRIAAMKVLRRFPALEAPLRDGRVCLSTVNLLGPLLTDENLDELVARAAFKSKAETEKLVVSIQPRVAPRDGVRRLPGSGRGESAAVAGPNSAAQTVDVPPAALAVHAPGPAETAAAGGAVKGGAGLGASPRPVGPVALVAVTPVPPEIAPDAPPAAGRPAPPSHAQVHPISGDLYSLRVTIDGACKEELDLLVSLLSHTTRGDLGAVLREAIRCGIAKHGKRRGAVEPERRRTPRAASSGTAPAANEASAGSSAGASEAQAGAPAAAATSSAAAPNPARPKITKRLDGRYIPAAVRREVWKRDGGRCAWTAPDGKRCGSTWRLEFDHVDAAALGGPPTVANIRLACEPHNRFHAVQTFGREFMAPYLGESTPAGGSHSA